jgi:hypothetical protein
MNRRQFTTTLTALAAAPAMPLKALTAAPAATAIPNSARFWAIYMSHLHGTCSAKTLSTMTGLDASVTQGYLSRMVSEGIIKPTRMASTIAEVQANRASKPSGLRDRLQKFANEKSESVKEAVKSEVLEPQEVEQEIDTPEDQS